MYKYFLVYGNYSWGGGNTLDEAKKNWKKAGGKGRSYSTDSFSSEQPFTNENSPYLDASGGICWKNNCTRD